MFETSEKRGFSTVSVNMQISALDKVGGGWRKNTGFRVGDQNLFWAIPPAVSGQTILETVKILGFSSSLLLMLIRSFIEMRHAREPPPSNQMIRGNRTLWTSSSDCCAMAPSSVISVI